MAGAKKNRDKMNEKKRVTAKRENRQLCTDCFVEYMIRDGDYLRCPHCGKRTKGGKL